MMRREKMPVKVVMPQLELYMTEGTIVEWLKQNGDEVTEKESIIVIETMKAAVEVEAPVSGTIYYNQCLGSTVPVGETIATIFAKGEAISVPIEPETSQEIQKKPVRQETRAREKRFLASPLAKKIAQTHQIDLQHVKGTGRNGVITKSDVLSYLETLEASQEDIIPLTGWRKTMADRMLHSVQTMAQLTTVTETDFTALLALRKQLITQEQTQLSITAFIIKAVAEALNEFPLLNSSLQDGQIILKQHRNIGIAVARAQEGLIVPVIQHADEKNVFEITQILTTLINRARDNKLSIGDITNGTFTITNVGMLGVTFNTPIINPPESAILGVGAIIKRPVVVENEITIRSIAYLCLSYDHRFIDGTPAVKFLQKIKQLLQDPESLIPRL
jgi:pyruvate/2-oxoglutarate dehydrogenase complex dihydrolipoamide acyltransferase (E2) component